MRVLNLLGIPVALRTLADGVDTRDLKVMFCQTRRGARCQYSGVCYFAKRYIRVSINPRNKYPFKVRLGNPLDPQKQFDYEFRSPEHLASFVFLHELSHWQDYSNGRNVRNKETKADIFAIERLAELGIR